MALEEQNDQTTILNPAGDTVENTAPQSGVPAGAVPMIPLGGSSQGSHFSGSDTEEPEPKKHKHLGLKIFLGVLAVLIVGAYGAGVFAFSNYFYPNTKIANIDVELLSAAQAKSAITRSWKNYQLTVSGNDFSWSYESESNSSIVDADKAVSQALEAQSPWTWPVGLYKAYFGTSTDTDESETVDLGQTVDYSLLSDAFSKDEFETSLGAAIDSYNEGKSGNFDTASAYDEEAGQFTVDAARKNEKLNRENVIAFAEIRLAELANDAELSDISDDAYEPLANGATDEQLQTACDSANEMLGVNVTLKLNGIEVGKIDGATVKQWISFGEDLTPALNTEAMNTWVSDLSSGFNTVGSERSYTRADGKQITVSGGSYGWQVDTEATAQAVSDAITNKTTGDVELSYSSSAAAWSGAGERDWGNRYIDVDLSEQHVRMYDDSGSLVWESDCVTGNTSQGHDTPTGVYTLNDYRAGGSDSASVELRGEVDPSTGEPEYISYVAYWMPFIGNSYAFHDATWRSSFGGTIYQYNGSHGCINLPKAKAAELFGLTQVGDVVVVHW